MMIMINYKQTRLGTWYMVHANGLTYVLVVDWLVDVELVDMGLMKMVLVKVVVVEMFPVEVVLMLKR